MPTTTREELHNTMVSEIADAMWTIIGKRGIREDRERLLAKTLPGLPSSIRDDVASNLRERF